MTQRMRRRGWLLGLTLALALLAAACGGADDAGGGGSGGATNLSGKVVIDGSSTVAPISEAIAEEFRKEQSGVQVSVGTSGTGGGFTKFCNGETDISDASRAIKDEEKQACQAKGVKYQEFRVGLDGLAVVTSAQNQFLDTLNFKQLAAIFKEGGAKTWNQVDPKFPDEQIAIFAPDTESGTYDFFNEEVLGDPAEGGLKPRSDYTASSDDNTLVQGIQGEKNSWGYFGYAYYQSNKEGRLAQAPRGAAVREVLPGADAADHRRRRLRGGAPGGLHPGPLQAAAVPDHQLAPPMPPVGGTTSGRRVAST
jgi:phosphate transport system substrate-binding protein